MVRTRDTNNNFKQEDPHEPSLPSLGRTAKGGLGRKKEKYTLHLIKIKIKCK